MAARLSGFYDEYHGHKLEHLEVLLKHIRGRAAAAAAAPAGGGGGGGGGIVWLAGDSSLDNKHWFPDTAPACNGYEDVLEPPTSVQDIAYWVNHVAVEQQLPLTALNCAVEESRVASRACGRLMAHDVFLRDNVGPDDYVVVSIGGNDIALLPTACTVLHMLALMFCTTTPCIERGACGCACPCDDPCCGCCCGCGSCPLACPPGLGYFINLFGARVQAYAERLVSGPHTPRKLLLCMIYYPDEAVTGSWADFTLSALGYNANPGKLQCLIRQVFRLATQRIRIPGTEVLAVPLFSALDGKHSADYTQRVEPSASGGSKVARLLVDCLCSGAGPGPGAAPWGSGLPGGALDPAQVHPPMSSGGRG